MKYLIDELKKEIVELIISALPEKDIPGERLEITTPPKSEMGDLAVSCFFLAKIFRRSPNQIAARLAKEIHPAGLLKSVQNIGPYLNFFINLEIAAKRLFREVKKEKAGYGRLKRGREKIMIEFSQPNTHKQFHIGHLRNAVLGDSLVRFNRFADRRPIAVNYLGDVGAHVAKCLWALDKFHRREAPPADKGKYLAEIYQEAVKKTEANPDYKKEADQVLKFLEDKEKKWFNLWKKTRTWSLNDFKRIYRVLGIEFDEWFFESEVEAAGKKIVAELLERGLAEKSQGAVIVDLEEYYLKKFLVLKSDGTSLYSTKDLALAKLKFQKYKPDKSIVITDSRQTFYFRQLFKVLELFGFDKPMIHLPYEFVALKDGPVASRTGQTVGFWDFYRRLKERAAAETKERHPDWPAKDISKVAEKIALAALKFDFLKVGNNQKIVFNIEEALKFDGFSGPYLQYTISRISSVLEKANFRFSGTIESSALTEDIERELVLKLADFPRIVGETVDSRQPSETAKYLFDLSRLFSTFYQTIPILSSVPSAKRARLALIWSVRQVLTTGLGLLGIPVLKKM